MALNLSKDELKSFHSLDRDLYSRLVTQLRRDPTQSLWVVALWLWLEEIGYPSIVLTLHSLPDNVVLEAFEEAVSILNCMQSPKLPTYTDLPRTCSLMDQNITLRLFHDNRGYALGQITKVVAEVCNETFDDIMKQATKIRTTQNAPILIPKDLPQNEGVKRRFVVRDSSSPTAQSDRTMFMTFSRGYPISEDELRTYILRSYGDVIKEIHMEQAPPNTQPLYARVVFISPSTVAKILNGRQRIKFVIKGKHVWTRRFVPRG